MLDHRRIAPLLAVAILSGSPAGAQPTGRVDARHPSTFTSISSVRELRDGRVIVADPTERRLELLDLQTGSVRPLAREGRGPGEFMQPLRLFALPGDSTLLYDPPNRRYLLLGPDGAPAGEVRADYRVRSASGGSSTYRVPAKGTDARGFLFLEAPEYANAESQPSDSVAVLRFDRATSRFDTLAHVRLEQANPVTVSADRTSQVTITGPQPFASRDEWVALPDGRVAIVHASPYQVEIVGAGGRRVGPVQTHRAVPVGDEEKRAWRARMGASMPSFGVARSGEGGARSAQTVRVPEPTSWPRTLPPFLPGAVWVRPNGDIWVERTRAARDAVPRFDIFDDRGARRTEGFAIPAGTRLVGFGRNAAYLAQPDADGLETLLRLRLP